MTGLDGDFAELDRMAKQLIAYQTYVEELARESAPAIRTLIEQQFLAAQDPYGHAWDRLAWITVRKKGHSTILFQTSDMFRSLDVQARGSTVRCEMDAPAEYHQHGGPDLPVRQVFPDEGDLPTAWEQAIQAASDRVLYRTGR